MNSTLLSTRSMKIYHQFSEMDDERLVLAAKSGEITAFNELRRRHADKVLRSTYRIVRNWEDSEDILQESFLNAYIHLKDFEGRSSFSSWLTRIAINLALMTLRRGRNRPEVSITSFEEKSGTWMMWELRDSKENPEGRYQRCERNESLIKAVSRLPNGTQTVIDQHLEGFSVREISRAHGISVAAVKSRLMRARSALKRSPALKRTHSTRFGEL